MRLPTAADTAIAKLRTTLHAAERTMLHVAVDALARLEAHGTLEPEAGREQPDLLAELASLLEQNPPAPGAATLFDGAVDGATHAVRTWLGIAIAAAARRKLETNGQAWLEIAAAYLDDQHGVVRGAGVALVRARILEDLERSDEASAAWTLALERDPILAYLLPESEWHSGDAGLGDEARAHPVRTFVRASATSPVESRASIYRAAEDPGASWEVSLVGIAEAIREALGLRGTDDAAAEAVLARALPWLGRFDVGASPEGCLLRAAHAIARGDDSRARVALAPLVARESDERRDAELDGLLAALRNELLKPPHDVAAVLRLSWYEVEVDPSTGLYVPRGPMATFRRALVAAMIIGTVTSASTAFAETPEVGGANTPDAAAGHVDPAGRADDADAGGAEAGGGGGGGGGHRAFGGGSGGGHHAFGGGGHHAFGGGGGHRAFRG